MNFPNNETIMSNHSQIIIKNDHDSFITFEKQKLYQ